MPAFQFSRKAWYLLALNMHALCLEPQQTKHFVAVDLYSKKIVFTHAGPTGLLCEDPDVIRALGPGAVICCYPHQAKKLYPDLPIVGDWQAKTHVHGSGSNYILSIEEGHDETVPEDKIA